MMRPACMTRFNLAHILEKRALLFAVNSICGIAILFFGYDQGMMSGVNNAQNYIQTMGLGYTQSVNGVPTPVITNSLRQGGIVSIYYLGCLVGALCGGKIGERVGRIKTIALAVGIAILGASLQCSAQNHVWMIMARLINGCGTGMLNSIIPVWATETAEFTSRGQFIAIEFTLNIAGVVIAYWMEYGLSYIDGGESQIRWRFPIGFQIILLILVFISVWFFPESPRWLAKVGRDEESRYILARLRGSTGDGERRAEAEFQEIKAVAALERSDKIPSSYLAMLFDTGPLHLGRRVQLVIWLQILQEWVGIAGVTIYAPTIFRLAGFNSDKANWISGLNNIFYMFSTLICVFTLDRIGRRITLFYGSVLQGISMFLCGGFTRLGLIASDAGNVAAAGRYGIAAASMIYLFTFTFGATWLTVPWLYPAEIFPLAVRAKGNAWGVVGWSIGNGWLALLLPVAFQHIGEKTYYLFGIANVISIPVVWAFYPESNQRTLEEMDLLFAAESPFAWQAEAKFAQLKEERPDIAHNAHHGQMMDIESGNEKRADRAEDQRSVASAT